MVGDVNWLTRNTARSRRREGIRVERFRGRIAVQVAELKTDPAGSDPAVQPHMRSRIRPIDCCVCSVCTGYVLVRYFVSFLPGMNPLFPISDFNVSCFAVKAPKYPSITLTTLVLRRLSPFQFVESMSAVLLTIQCTRRCRVESN